MIIRSNVFKRAPSARNTLVESMPDGILVISDDEHIEDINPAAERLTGITGSYAIGKTLQEVSPELSSIYRKLQSGESTGIVFEITGKKTYLDINITGLFNRQGLSRGKLILFHDVSENKAKQQKLESAYNENLRLCHELRDEIEKRSKHTRAIVHELNSPLTAILSSSELLAEMNLDKMPTSLVQNIRRAALNLEQRSNELIDLARGEVGNLKIVPAPLEIPQLINEIVSEMIPAAAEKGLKLITYIPDSFPLAEGDKGRLRQVLMNLLSNAIKFTKEGQITVRARYDAKSLEIQVEDTGPGLEKERLENLFDPYRRQPASNSPRYSGLGIGLALCKMFIELHHGKIWVGSVPGKGSTFSFKIPLAAETAISPDTRDGLILSLH